MEDGQHTLSTDRRSLVVVTLWLAIVTGLVEGLVSVVMMKAGYLPGAWWDLLWVSPLFDVVLFGCAGVALTGIARAVGRPALTLVLPGYGFLTASIWLGLVLPYQVHMAALLVLAAGIGVQFTRVVLPRLPRVLAFWRRTLRYVVAAVGVAFLALVPGRPIAERVEASLLPPPPTDAPSVVLIVVDALRADHLSTHGYRRDTSPTVADLAAGGVSFRAAFSSSPYTAPSHASLLTGLYPFEHGVQWIERRPILSNDHATIAEELSRVGYRTGAFSANRFWFTREQRFGRGFLHFEDNYHTLGDALVRTAYGRKIEEWVLRRLFEDYPWRRRADDITDAVTSWVAADRDRPFFAMLNYFDVHDPYFPPAPYRGMFSDVDEPGGVLNSHQDRYHPEMTPEQLQEEIDAYDGSISYVDGEIRRLLDAIGGLPAADDLVVIVTADHGEAFGEHGAYIHANALYLEEIHVPLVVWSPGRVPEGFVSDRPVSNASVPATILDVVGAKSSPFGVPSLGPLWTDAAAAARHPLPVSEMEHWPWNLETSKSHYGAIRGVVGPEYHYMVNDSLGAELYRWRDDPQERVDLIGDEGHEAALRTLREALGHGGG